MRSLIKDKITFEEIALPNLKPLYAYQRNVKSKSQEKGLIYLYMSKILFAKKIPTRTWCA